MMLPLEHRDDRILLNIAESAIDAGDTAAIAQALVDAMAPLLDADACYLSFWNAAKGAAEPAAAYGPRRGDYSGFRIEPGERNLTASVVAERRAIAVEDARDSGYVSERIARYFEAGAFLGLPLELDERALGAVILAFSQPRRFTPDDLSRAERAARLASFVVSRSRLLDEERRRAEELAALNSIGIAINSDRRFERVVETILERCLGIIDLDTFYVALYDEAREELEFPLFYDGGRRLSPGPHHVGGEESLSGFILRSRSPMLIPDTLAPELNQAFRLFHIGGIQSRSYLGVPLIYGDKVLGLMSVQSKRPHAYAPEQLRLVETVAAQSAIAIENARLYAELERLSITDGLTGAYNFRHLLELGAAEFAKAKRHGRALALLFLDIDRFRDFNGRHGHAVGNEVLKAVSATVRGSIRDVDAFARFGGEEFVAILPETDPAAAALVAERVRAAVETLRVPSAAGELAVTVSVGWATTVGGAADFQALMNDANDAERLAKTRGRNRVEGGPDRLGHDISRLSPRR